MDSERRERVEARRVRRVRGGAPQVHEFINAMLEAHRVAIVAVETAARLRLHNQRSGPGFRG